MQRRKRTHVYRQGVCHNCGWRKQYRFGVDCPAKHDEILQQERYLVTRLLTFVDSKDANSYRQTLGWPVSVGVANRNP